MATRGRTISVGLQLKNGISPASTHLRTFWFVPPSPLRRGTVRLDSVSACPPVVPQGGSEEQLAAAVSITPTAVAIEADQQAFQQYKSGVFSASWSVI